jgi:hypothetical protein
VSAGPLGAGLRWAVAEARALVMLERFLALLEQASDAGPAPDSLRPLSDVVRGWRSALRTADDATVLDAGARTWSALDACRQGVIARDGAIPAYRIRWACEHAPLSASQLGKLARFYRALPYSSATQSKYEYVLTRLLGGPLHRRRALLAAPHEALEQIAQIEKGCGADPVLVKEAKLSVMVGELAAFVREARAQPDLASLTASSVFQRAGAFKAQLGVALFEPRVALAVVECNLRLGNVFCELLAHEADEAAAHAPAAGAPAGQAETAPAAPPAPAPPAPQSPAAGEEAAHGEELPLSPSPRAAELGKQPENAAVIEAYLQPPRSDDVYELDLDRFLGALPGGGDAPAAAATERRRALELILAADDLVQARDAGAAGDEHRAQVKRVTRDMLAHGNALAASLARAQEQDPASVETLFYVSDHLLWARLRLTASLNRPPRKRITLARAAKAAPPPEPTARSLRRRLLPIAALASIALIFLPRAFARPMAIDAEVRVVDLTGVPGSAYLYDVRQHRSVLYVSVLPSWAAQSEGSRRDHLRALAEYGAMQGVDTVRLADRRGQPLGQFADGEPTLASELPLEGSPVP